MSLHSSWVHGNSAFLEHPGSNSATNQRTVREAFNDKYGDLVLLGHSGGAACLRMGWGARFVILDVGRRNYGKSGEFWVHYAISTPVVEDGHRAQADTVLVNYESTDIQQIKICEATVWDGNRRIFADHSVTPSANGYDGGIAGRTSNSGTRPNTAKLWRGNIRRQDIFFGLQVSLKIQAHHARDNYLEIRGVGIEFQILD